MLLARPARYLWFLLGCALLLAACGGGDEATDGTATPGGPDAEVAAPTPTPQWPEVARATITTEDLNVRTGPGSTYPVVGRLQPDDQVPVAARLAGGEWLALPGIGWIVYAQEWMQLSVDFGSLPEVTEPGREFEFAGPVYPTDARAGIPVVDEVVAAIVSRDRDHLIALATAAPPPSASATPAQTATAVATLPPETTETASTPAAPPAGCSDQPIPGIQLRDHIDALYQTRVPAAARGGDGQGVLRLYGVVRGPVPANGSADYVVVFAFEDGEGRQVWISPDGRITQFTLPCEPTLPGSLLRVTDGEPFFWFRPAVQPPVRPLP
jgi:hypothetical protein